MLTLKLFDCVVTKYDLMRHDIFTDQDVTIPAGSVGTIVMFDDHGCAPLVTFPDDDGYLHAPPPHALELTDEPTETEPRCLFDWDVFIMLAAVNAANFSWVSE